MHHKTFPRVRATTSREEPRHCRRLPPHAARRAPIRLDRLDAEGQHQSPAAGRALKALDALSKLLDNRAGGRRIHVLGNGSEDYMFYICSHSAKRVNWSLT
jgi:hypothetical protein